MEVRSIVQEVAMGYMVSHVPKLLADEKWGARDLYREIVKLDEKIGLETCYRLAEGDTNTTLRTAGLLCKVFRKPIQKVFEYKEDEQARA